jgi:hypothetical protein
MLAQPDVGFGASLEQRLQNLQVPGSLIVDNNWLRVSGAIGPASLQHAVKRRGASLIGNIWIGTCLDQDHGCVELAVDGGHQERRCVISLAWNVNPGAAGNERTNRINAPLACGKVKCGQTSDRVHQS